MLETIFQDVRYALRTFRQNLGFTTAALLTLALGIGANTAVFSVIDGVLLNPIPFPDADDLVVLHEAEPNSDRDAVSYPNLIDWRRLAQSFEAIAAWRDDLFTMNDSGQPEQLIGMMVTADFFSVLRAKPVLGRTFTTAEDQRGAARVVLLGEDFWKSRFASDRTLIGKSIKLNGRDYTVIGVAPAGIRISRSGNRFFNDVFLPIGQYEDPFFYERGVGFGTVGLGRLKPGVTLEQARAEMNTIMRSLAAEYPEQNATTGANLTEFSTYLVGNLEPVLLSLAAAVGFVLLIACTNVANLALVRSNGRRQEFGVRLALGAARSRLMRQLLTESALISIGGGVIGVLIASWGTHAALEILPSALPAMSSVEINARVLLFSFVVSLIAGVLFGLLPAFKTSRLGLNDVLKQSGRGSVRVPYRAQRLLITAEVALTLMLLVGAGLMLRSLQNLWNVNPGFDPEGVLTFYTGISPQRAVTPQAIRAAFMEINDRLASIPGVQSASVQVGGMPFRGNSTTSFRTDNEVVPQKAQETRTANFYAVGPDHLEAMGIPLTQGRSFTRQDTADGRLVLVIDEHLARSAFPGQDPIGKRLYTGLFDERPAEIVGIAGHVKHSGLDTEATAKEIAQFYVPITQLPDGILPMAANMLAGIVRSNSVPVLLLPAIKKELGTFDAGRAVHSEQRMTESIAVSLAGRRFSLIVLGSFAASALFLSIVGVYSVVSYFVGQRINEIGVRIALGAQPRDVFWSVIADASKLGLIGVAAGLVGAAVLTRFMTSLLFGVSPTDAVTFVFAALLLYTFTLIACFVPARRAVQVDPMTALRCE